MEQFIINILTTCFGVVLAKVLIDVYPKIRNFKLASLLPKKASSDELEKEVQFRNAVAELLHSKPAMVKKYKPGDIKTITYFESKLRGTLQTQDPLLHTVLLEELAKGAKQHG